MKACCALLVLCTLGWGFASDAGFEKQIADAEQAYEKRNFREVIEKFKPILPQLETLPDRKKLADIYFKYGRSNRRLGNFADAHEYLNRAKKLHTEIEDKTGLAFDITEIATAHQRQGKYDEALKLSQEALVLHQQNNNDLGIARTYDTFGNIYYRTGEFEKSIRAFEAALDAARKSGDQEALCITLSGFGPVFWARGEYDRALQMYEQAIQIAEQLGDKMLMASPVGNRALIYKNQGDLKRASEEYQRVAAIFREVGNKAGEAIAYLNLGSVQHVVGNYGKSLESTGFSLKIAREIEDQGLEANALSNIALLELEIGNHDAAHDYAQQSLKLSEQLGEKELIASDLVLLGKIAFTRGEGRTALKYLKQATELDRETGNKKSLHSRLSDLGDLYASTGDLKEALQSYEEAAGIQESLGFKDDLGLMLTKIGAIHHRNGNLARAEQVTTQGVALLRESLSPQFLWQALYNQGLISAQLGRRDQSVEQMKEAIHTLEEIREGVVLPEQKLTYFEQRLDIYEDLILQLVETNQSEAFEYVQRSKTRSFLDLLSESKIDPHANLDPDLYRLKRKLIAQLVKIDTDAKEQQEKDQPDKTLLAQLQQRRTKTDQEYQKLMLQIRNQNPRLAEIQAPQLLTLTDAQTLLDEQSVLLDYFVGKKQSLLFAITKDRFRVFQLPQAGKLSQEVQQLLQAIQKPDPSFETTEGAHGQYVTLASNLYNAVLKPAETMWKSKKRVTLATDGPLNYLPFEVLLTSGAAPKEINFDTLPYFGLGHEVNYVPSISSLAAIMRDQQPSQTVAQKELLAVADPVQGRSPTKPAAGDKILRDWSSSLMELPHARSEVERISKLYPKDQTTTLIGDDANEAKIKTLPLVEFRTLHFASHGLIDEDRPHFSSIYLNPGTAEEDGYLTMREVFDLKLNSDLVVLSACKTGLGRNVRGEGVMGLARAFFYAGTSSVLVSLWSVDDRSTAEFMTAFYSARRLQNTNKSAALKIARTTMIQQKTYSHPYYWSPFILIGNR